jgi:hypothetical protein
MAQPAKQPEVDVESVVEPAETIGEEVLRYRWHLGGLLGNVASLFIPGEGDGQLTTTRFSDASLKTELHITSTKSKKGDFWRYGSAFELEPYRALRAWSSYLFRGKSKDKAAELEEQDVIDVASAIYLLRQDPPISSRRMTIWSDGKIYPVEVRPGDRGVRTVADQELVVRDYLIQGVMLEGSGFWKDEMYLVLAEDDATTPVEIFLKRGMANVKLLLVDMERRKPRSSKSKKGGQ